MSDLLVYTYDFYSSKKKILCVYLWILLPPHCNIDLSVAVLSYNIYYQLCFANPTKLNINSFSSEEIFMFQWTSPAVGWGNDFFSAMLKTLPESLLQYLVKCESQHKTFLNKIACKEPSAE